MDITQVSAIVKSKIDMMKPNVMLSTKKNKEKKYNCIYDDCCKLRERIRVHTELDYVPEKLLKTKAPYEDEAQFEWRKNNIQPVTMPFFMRAMSTLNRIFNKSNYSIKYEDKEQGDYFIDYLPLFGSIDNYAEQIIITQKIYDPNGVVVVKPFLLPMKEEIITDEKGKESKGYVYDDSELLQPVPVIYNCENVIDYVDGHYCLVMTEEKSPVKFGTKLVNEGLVFEFYDKTTIYKIKQTGNKNDFTFSNPEIYYQHNIGELPVQKLKGIPKTKETAVLYYSYFIYAIPNLDLAYYGMSNLDMSITSHIFPQKWEYVDRCENAQCGGRGYYDEYIDEKQKRTLCGDCNGTGNKLKTGPMNVKTIHKPDAITDPAGTMQIPNPAIGFVDPPTGSLDFTYKKYRNDIDDAFAHLNIRVSNDNVRGGNDNTAKGKEIDREELFSFILRISNEVFATTKFIIEMMGGMRYGDSWKGVQVSPPQNFSMLTANDLMEELKTSESANIPDIVLRSIVQDYSAKRFVQDSYKQKIFEVAEYCDRLILYDTIQIAGKLASGTIAKWEAILHDSIYTFILNELNEKEGFLEQEYDAIKTRLIEVAKQTELDLQPISMTTEGIIGGG